MSAPVQVRRPPAGGPVVTEAVDVLAVMDADGRAVALLSDEYYDAGKSNLAEKWSDHLSVHDEARAAVAELIEKSAAALHYMRLHKYADQAWSDDLAAALARVQGGAA